MMFSSHLPYLIFISFCLSLGIQLYEAEQLMIM
uniref:Uncharacterized protein n=1 Tax=Arundo donax TaxID=35708 RepID=A0A0A9AFJ9_ARUDO